MHIWGILLDNFYDSQNAKKAKKMLFLSLHKQNVLNLNLS